MEEIKEAAEQNNEEVIETKAEESKPAEDNVVDEDIQYTFVVPKGEIYVDPDLEAPAPDRPQETPDKDAAAETDPADQDDGEVDLRKTIVADSRRYANIEPPVYAATGLPEDDDIIYTFVVPKGEIYTEPDPEEERAQKEAERARRALLAEETKVMERRPADGADSDSANYGLPAGHPEMGELAQKQEARRLYKQRKKNRFRTRFYVLMSILVLAAGWLVLSNSGLFTIDAIVVQGNSHYTAEEIINMGHASPGRNIIYKANIKETKEFLENNPYIKHAEVRRRLPSTLVIKVTERQERLAFKYDDDYLIMDEDGILLKKTRNKPTTTIIQGIVVSKIKLGEKIGTENDERMDKALDLIKTMINSDLYYVNIDITKEKSIKAYIYETLVVKADYDTLKAAMEDGRLHLVVEKLFEDNIKRGTITFREDGTASFVPTF